MEYKFYYHSPLKNFILGLLLLIISIIYLISFAQIFKIVISVIIILFSISILFQYIVMNIFRKIYIKINEAGIILINLSGTHVLLWEEIVSYGLIQKVNYTILSFQSKKSLKNYNILKSKDALKISSIYLKDIKMHELIDIINKNKNLTTASSGQS